MATWYYQTCWSATNNDSGVVAGAGWNDERFLTTWRSFFGRIATLATSFRIRNRDVAYRIRHERGRALLYTCDSGGRHETTSPE